MISGLSRQRQQEAEFLKKTAEFYEEETMAAITANCLILGPTIVATLGLLGLGVLVAFYLPIFHTVAILP
jgi:type II secretory pathway component PulF